MERIILKGGTVVRGGGSVRADIAVRGGVIERIADDITVGAGDRAIDCAGRIVASGLVDLHVHLREPGFSAKETIATGTAAAARGGFTTVCAMPNLDPAPDSTENLRRERDIIARDAKIKVLPYATITLGRKGERSVDFAALKPYVAGFSDDGSGVQSDAAMRTAMTEAAALDCIIAAHCEVNELLRGGYIHDGEYAALHGHKGICSESEWQQVERDIALAEKTGCQYHVCHVSTRESVELVRQAKARGLRVSCETAPHYLLLCDEDLREEGRFKMNPPLRSRADRAALLEGIADGTIEVIATDHAPHTAEEKSRGLAGSAMGIVGLECAFPLLYKYLVLPGTLALERLVELMSVNPRRIFGLGGGLEPGQAADFTVLDLAAQYELDPAAFRSKGRATPFAGWPVQGRAAMTVMGGETAYECTIRNS